MDEERKKHDEKFDGKTFWHDMEAYKRRMKCYEKYELGPKPDNAFCEKISKHVE